MIRSLLVCGLLLTSFPVLAQTTADPAAPPAAAPLAAAPAQNELLALNFYVQQKDQAAIAAEVRRLRLRYPGWTPPADLSRLSVTAPSSEIDQIYRQIANGQYDAARATIAATQEAFPDWLPPSEMTSLLETAEGQKRFDTALSSGNLTQAIGVAGEAPGLLRCDRINNAWRIAEAQQTSGRTGEALGTYRAILGACVVPSDILATLEKADTVTTTAEIQALLAQTATRLPALRDQIDVLGQRLLAGRGEADAVPGAPLAPAPAAPRAPAVPRAPAPVAVAPAAPAPAPVARRATGGGGGGGAPASSGFQAAVNAGDWSRCLALSTGSRSAAVTYQRGWCAFNLDQPMEAATAFRTSLQGNLDVTQRRDARYGLALTYLKMHMVEEAARLATSSDFTHQQRVEVERQILDQRGVAAYQRKQYNEAVAYFNALEQISGGIRRDLAMLRAYAYLNAGNRARAKIEFQRLNDALSTDETRRGLRASQG